MASEIKESMASNIAFFHKQAIVWKYRNNIATIIDAEGHMPKDQ